MALKMTCSDSSPYRCIDVYNVDKQREKEDNVFGQDLFTRQRGSMVHSTDID